MYIKSCILLTALSVVTAFAEDSIAISGWGSYNFGRVESGFTQFAVRPNGPIERDLDFTHRWLSHFQGGLKVEKRYGYDITVRFHFGFTSVFQIVDNTTNGGGANLELVDLYE